MSFSKSIYFSPIETKRFGLRVYRGIINDINPLEILSAVIKENIDVAIVRIPAGKENALTRLEETGIPFLVSDSLVYYYLNLERITLKGLRNKDLEFVEYKQEHHNIINNLVSEIFADYKNHYFANPLFSLNLTEAYSEWAQSYVTHKAMGKWGWLVKRGDRFIGFATCDIDKDKCEIVLNGIIPQERRLGVYSDLVNFIQRFSKNIGCSILKTSTQLQNYSVQRIWNREGFVIEGAFHTVHINSLMNASLKEKKVLKLKFTENDVNQYIPSSGAMNTKHLSKASVQNNGFECRPAMANLINSIVSKYYVDDFPGNTTVITGYSNKFIKPIYFDRSYSIEISFPFADTKRGIYKSLVKLVDSSGEICFFSYNDLTKKKKSLFQLPEHP
jgi:hypothetical protein